jgi:hypothetical protein
LGSNPQRTGKLLAGGEGIEPSPFRMPLLSKQI